MRFFSLVQQVEQDISYFTNKRVQLFVKIK